VPRREYSGKLEVKQNFYVRPPLFDHLAADAMNDAERNRSPDSNECRAAQQTSAL
jgi:hypothetical protein